MKNLIFVLVVGIGISGCTVSSYSGNTKVQKDSKVMDYGYNSHKPKIVKQRDKCYKEVVVPAKYKYKMQKVPKVVKSFKYGTKKVLVKKGHHKEIKNKKYKYKKQKVMVKPESYKHINTPSGGMKIKIPAVFKYKMVRVGGDRGKKSKIKMPPIYKQVATKIPVTKTIYVKKRVKVLVTPKRTKMQLVDCKKVRR